MLDPNNPYASAMPVESQGGDPNRSGAWIIPSLDSAASPVLALLRTVASAYIQLALGITLPMVSLLVSMPIPDRPTIAVLPALVGVLVVVCMWAGFIGSAYWSMRQLIPRAWLALLFGAAAGAGMGSSAASFASKGKPLDIVIPAMVAWAVLGGTALGSLAACIRAFAWVIPQSHTQAMDRARHAMRHPRGRLLATALYGRAAVMARDAIEREQVEQTYRDEFEAGMARDAGPHRTAWISWAGLFLFAPPAFCGALAASTSDTTVQTIAGVVMVISLLVALVLVFIGVIDALARRHMPVRDIRPLRWVTYWLVVVALSILYVNLGRTMRHDLEQSRQEEMQGHR